MEPLSIALLAGGLSGVGGAIVVWLLRTWIAERIRQDVQHVYAQKLEAYKTELSSHAELQQLRTSLFFEHQRSAFSTLLSKIVETNQKWQSAHYEPGIGMAGPVPSSAYRDLRDAYYANQLFLDTPCLAALDLLFDYYTDSLPFLENPDGPPIPRDTQAAYDSVMYLLPRIAQLFRQKIGVPEGGLAAREIALLGAIRILNNMHFEEIQVPVTGSLRLTGSDEAADAVSKASEHIDELLLKLKQLHAVLGQRRNGTFHEQRTEVSRYLSMLGAGTDI